MAKTAFIWQIAQKTYFRSTLEKKYPYKFNPIKTKFLQEQPDTIAHSLV